MSDVGVIEISSSRGGAPDKASSAGTRRHNLALVLRQVLDGSANTRASIARAVGLTRVAISSLVSELIEDRLICEVGTNEKGRPGKPATLLDIDGSFKRIATIDLSAHGLLSGAVTDLRGRVLEQVSIPIQEMQGENLLNSVVDLGGDLKSLAGPGLIGLGVGAPGKISADGVVEGADRLGWRNVELGRVLSERVGVTVCVANDADLAALAESRVRGTSQDLLLIYLARGVGARLILGGRIFGGAGEIAHISVDPDGPECRCGKRGCLEVLLSASVLAEQLIREPHRSDEILTRAGERLGAALTVTVGLLDVPEVVIHAPQEVISDRLLSSIADTINRRNHTVYRNDVVVNGGVPGTDLVLQGARLRVWSEVLGVT